MQTERYTPFVHMPWIRWIDNTEIPSIVIGVVVILIFIPFYDFNALAPRMPLQGGAFPPAFALCLTFLLLVTRGAMNDLAVMISADKVDPRHLAAIAPSTTAAFVELGIGVAIGVERIHSQVSYAIGDLANYSVLMEPASIALCLSIVMYTVVQVHLFTFCVRQVLVFRRIAIEYEVDLLAYEYNNILTNPMIRFVVIGLVAISFGTLVYEMVPFASLQTRVLQAGMFAGLIWLALIAVSMVPLFVLKRRIAIAKKLEISVIRRALNGDLVDSGSSQFGERINEFSPADLMFYEDRIRNIWEWPFEDHIRRLVIFGLLPPLTWMLAAIIEIAFETFLTS